MSGRRRKLQGLTERLNVAVIKSGMPHAEIRKRMRIPKSTFYQHLAGDTDMSALYAARYCAVLNVSADWLLGINQRQEN